MRIMQLYLQLPVALQVGPVSLDQQSSNRLRLLHWTKVTLMLSSWWGYRDLPGPKWTTPPGKHREEHVGWSSSSTRSLQIVMKMWKPKCEGAHLAHCTETKCKKCDIIQLDNLKAHACCTLLFMGGIQHSYTWRGSAENSTATQLPIAWLCWLAWHKFSNIQIIKLMIQIK